MCDGQILWRFEITLYSSIHSVLGLLGTCKRVECHGCPLPLEPFWWYSLSSSQKPQFHSLDNRRRNENFRIRYCSLRVHHLCRCYHSGFFPFFLSCPKSMIIDTSLVPFDFKNSFDAFVPRFWSWCSTVQFYFVFFWLCYASSFLHDTQAVDSVALECVWEESVFLLRSVASVQAKLIFWVLYNTFTLVNVWNRVAKFGIE